MGHLPQASLPLAPISLHPHQQPLRSRQYPRPRQQSLLSVSRQPAPDLWPWGLRLQQWIRLCRVAMLLGRCRWALLSPPWRMTMMGAGSDRHSTFD